MVRVIIKDTLTKWTLVKKRVELKLQTLGECTQVNSSVQVACLRIDLTWILILPGDGTKKVRERERAGTQ